MKKKHCRNCGYNLQKWGKTSKGKQRYRCLNCRKSEIRSRKDIDEINKRKLFEN